MTTVKTYKKYYYKPENSGSDLLCLNGGEEDII